MPATRRIPDRLSRTIILTALLCVLTMLPALAAPAKAADAGRTDNVFGTTREGMDMGRDPATGDMIMRVSPPPPSPDQQQDMHIEMPTEIRPEISPEITVPPAKPKHKPQP